MRLAAIGIGSNSTRLLVAEREGEQVRPCLRLSIDTHLFSGLQGGKLSAESMERAVQAVAFFAARAQAEGCQALRVLATSATRDAANAAELDALVRAACGAPLEVLSGEEEALFSFWGATGRTAESAGVLDIGGGSTELAVGGRTGLPRMVSLQLGSSRLSAMFPDLTGEGALRALAFAREGIAEGWHGLCTDKPTLWFSAGGNGVRLAAAERLRQGLDAGNVDGYAFTLAMAAGWARRLSQMTVEERAQVPGLPPSRAGVVAHGAILLQAAMEVLGMESVHITRRTNLDGVMLGWTGQAGPVAGGSGVPQAAGIRQEKR